MLRRFEGRWGGLPAWRPRPRAPRPPAGPYELAGPLRTARAAALTLIAAVVLTATAVALAESYHALYVWALHHEVTLGWARWFPAMVDTFVVVGELALFVAVLDGWPLVYRLYVWLVILGGLAVSVAGNIGHLQTGTAADRLTSAVPPVAAFVALTVGMMVLKRLLERSGHLAGAVSAGADTMTALRAVVSAMADNADTRGIVTALVDVGVTDTATLAAITGVTERTVRRHKSPAAAAEPAASAQGPDAAAARSRHAASQPRRLATVAAEQGGV